MVNPSLENCNASLRIGRYCKCFQAAKPSRTIFAPVREDLLGEMYRANENGLPQLVESVSSEVRAMLALFLLSPEPPAFAGGLDRRKLQRARADPVGRPRRLYIICAVARSAGRALLRRRRPMATASRSRCRPSRSARSRRLTTRSTKISPKPLRRKFSLPSSRLEPGPIATGFNCAGGIGGSALPIDHAVWVPAFAGTTNQNHPSTANPCRFLAIAHSGSPGMQVRQTSGRTA